MFIPEFGVIYGYDDEKQEFYCKDPSHEGPLPYAKLNELPLNFVCMLRVQESIPVDPKHAWKKALNRIVQFAREQAPTLSKEFRHGLAGYEAWIQAFRSRTVNPFGNAYNAEVVGDAREYAAQFLRSLPAKWLGNTALDNRVRELAEEAAIYYEKAAEALDVFQQLFPHPHGGEPNDPVNAEEAIRLLEQAKASEASGENARGTCSGGNHVEFLRNTKPVQVCAIYYLSVGKNTKNLLRVCMYKRSCSFRLFWIRFSLNIMGTLGQRYSALQDASSLYQSENFPHPFFKRKELNMKIPVIGFVVNSGGDDIYHSHKLYITSWNGNPVPVHVHAMSGITSFNDGHTHQYSSWTAPAQTGVPHVHGYYMITSLDQGHTHVIQGTTGPAIPLPGGGHYHLFEGYTTINGSRPHSHAYSGRTGNEVNAR